MGEVEALLAVMMMEHHMEQVVITVMMATVGWWEGWGEGWGVGDEDDGDGGKFVSGSCKLDPVLKP